MERTETKLNNGDLLFAFQMGLSWMSTYPQIVRSFTSTAGMTITWPLFSATFALVNLFLALGQYKESRSRKALQIVAVYANWLVLWFAMLVSLCVHGSWRSNDTTVSMLIVAALVILLFARREGSLTATIAEPVTRGLVSLIVKSVPQLFIAYCIAKAGRNDGLSGMTLAIGHISICTRVSEMYFVGQQDGWTSKNQALMISELGNELSWCVTTLAWFAYNH